MPTIKFDVSGTEPNQAGAGEQPKPGLYTAEIHEITLRDDREEGKETDLEIIYRILDEDTMKPNAKYSRVWDYVGLENETTEWKRAQFFEAIGVADENSRSGSFDPEDHALKFNGKETDLTRGTYVKMRVRGDSWQGEYRAKVGSVIPMLDQDDGDGEDPFA